jgi:hypothetical protein
MHFLMASRPPLARVALVETLVWQPAPFQSPLSGLGCSETLTPHLSRAGQPAHKNTSDAYISATRSRRKRAIHIWSPESMPLHGPTWYSHWAGMTSALMPEMLTPA